MPAASFLPFKAIHLPGVMRDLTQVRRLLLGNRTNHGSNLSLVLGTCLILIVLASAVQALSPLALRDTINGLVRQEHATASLLLVIYALMFWLGKALQGGVVLSFGRAWRMMRRRAIGNTYWSLLGIKESHASGRNTGRLSQLISEALIGIRSLVSAAVFGIIPTFIQLIIVSGVMIWIARPDLLGILGAFVGLYTTVFYLANLRQKSALQAAVKADLKAAEQGAELLAGRETIKLLVIRDRVCARLDEVACHAERRGVSFFLTQFWAQQVLAGLLSIVLLALLLLSMWKMEAGQLTIGDFVMVHAIALQVLGPLERLVFGWREASQALVHLRELLDALSDPSEQEGSGPALRRDASKGIFVSFEQVDFAYPGGHQALSGVTIDIEPGEYVSLVGPNGSGKSTLWRLLCKLHEPAGGVIRINGRDIREHSVAAVRSMVAVASAEPTIFSGSVRSNIEIGLEATEQRTSEISQIMEAARHVGSLSENAFEKTITEKGGNLSAGERQRLAIARSVARSPRLLVLDEATSALDPHAETRVMEAIDKSRQSGEFGVLMIAHKLALVRNSSRIYVMDKGRVKESGTHEELIRRGGLYAAMWMSQQEQQSEYLRD